MTHISRIPKWVKIVIGIITGIVVVVGVIGGVTYMNHEREKQYMVNVAKSSEAHKLIEDSLKEMDKNALTDTGKIKNYKIDYDSVKHHPMGGIWVTAVVNDDKDMTVAYHFNKSTISEYTGEPILDFGGFEVSRKLDNLLGYTDRLRGELDAQ